MKCKGCAKSITHYLDKWWDESEDYVCTAAFGEHVPNVPVIIPAQKAYPTLGPKAKWSSQGQGRMLPIYSGKGRGKRGLADN